MAKYRSSSLRSKWKKTSWLLRDPNLRKHVPKTMLFNKQNLITMLSSYSTVYFKPTDGSGGFRIIRITKQPRGYQTQYNRLKYSYSTIGLLFNKLLRFSNKRSFLLQKGIDLARAHGNPFDIRVMVQKTNKGSWVSTAMFTKIGRRGKVATNYNQGGRVRFFHQTLSAAGYNKARIQRKETALRRMGVSVGKNFDHYRRGFRELGLDIALDSAGKPWILEVNTRPQFYPLKNMKDKGLYRRILSYAKPYGRHR